MDNLNVVLFRDLDIFDTKYFTKSCSLCSVYFKQQIADFADNTILA